MTEGGLKWDIWKEINLYVLCGFNLGLYYADTFKFKGVRNGGNLFSYDIFIFLKRKIHCWSIEIYRRTIVYISRLGEGSKSNSCGRLKSALECSSGKLWICDKENIEHQLFSFQIKFSRNTKKLLIKRVLFYLENLTESLTNPYEGAGSILLARKSFR